PPQCAPPTKPSTANPVPTLITRRAPKQAPPLRFQGLVMGGSEDKVTALISWQGQTLPVQVGDSFPGLRIMALSAEQMQVRCQDSLWSLSRQ
ncbi:MAG: hypothetical protein AAF804_19875, partial [Bacteroidota bacterium]